MEWQDAKTPLELSRTDPEPSRPPHSAWAVADLAVALLGALCPVSIYLTYGHIGHVRVPTYEHGHGVGTKLRAYAFIYMHAPLTLALTLMAWAGLKAELGSGGWKRATKFPWLPVATAACFLSLAVLHVLCLPKGDRCCDRQTVLRVLSAAAVLLLPELLKCFNESCVVELCAVAAVCIAQLLADMALLSSS